jgi:spore germination protein
MVRKAKGMGILKKLFKQKQKTPEQFNSHAWSHLMLSGDIRDNISRLNEIMNHSSDLKSREFNLAGSSRRAAILFISTLANEDMIQEHILKPLIMESAVFNTRGSMDLNDIRNSMLSADSIQIVESFDDIVLGVMAGDTILTIQGYDKGILIHTRGNQGRTVGEPATEPSVKGPQEAFVEILKINIGLIRRRLLDPNLCFEMHKMGRRAKADYVIAYMKGIANKELVSEIKNRLSVLDVDGQATTAQMMRMIVDRPNSIFPLIQVTERPDKVVSALSEGRVAILMNGNPEAVIAPTTLPILMHSSDDYFENWMIASVIRLSRMVGVFVTALFPALYIAVTAFHPDMLPINLVLSITSSRMGVPFPAYVEALLMVFTLELLQEAGIRLPRVVGQTVSIVGGLVIGQAAVFAGIVSPLMVIITSITAVASFTVPDYSLGLALRFLRVPFMILAVTLGSFGVAMGMLAGLTYLASLKSFGLSYLEPIGTRYPSDWKDGMIRGSLWSMKKRPKELNPEDPIRLSKRKREKNRE